MADRPHPRRRSGAVWATGVGVVVVVATITALRATPSPVAAPREPPAVAVMRTPGAGDDPLDAERDAAARVARRVLDAAARDPGDAAEDRVPASTGSANLDPALARRANALRDRMETRAARRSSRRVTVSSTDGGVP